MPILDDVEQVTAILGVELGQPPIVDYKDAGFGDRRQQFHVATVGARWPTRSATAGGAGTRRRISARRPTRRGRPGRRQCDCQTRNERALVGRARAVATVEEEFDTASLACASDAHQKNP